MGLCREVWVRDNWTNRQRMVRLGAILSPPGARKKVNMEDIRAKRWREIKSVF